MNNSFEKALSTAVETALEKHTKKPVWNFVNNTVAIRNYIRNLDAIRQEAAKTLRESPKEIDQMIEKMKVWYRSQEGGSYDPELVDLVTEELTIIIVANVGATANYNSRLAKWKAKQA